MSFQYELIKSLKSNAALTAVEENGHAVSYETLLYKANQVSRFLLDKKLAPETAVGVSLANRADLIIAMIGVMNARCVFVPVDASLPDNRLAAIQKDLDLQYLITTADSAVQQRFTGLGIAEVVSIDSLFTQVAGDALDKDDYAAGDSLYIYFTSGTTGKPKGVIGANASLLQFVQWEIAEFAVGEGSRFSQLVSPYFDAFLRDVFVPLLAGGTICIPPANDQFFTPDTLTAWINTTGVQYIHCVPSVFRVFNQKSITANDFAALQYIMLSGEKIIPSDLTHWYRVFGSRIQLVNFYGATESTMIRAFYRIQPADVSQAKIPVGGPIADTELLVVKDGKPCGVLVTGELYIVSEYITKGYLNQPELTREKFITLPNGEQGTRKAYKTGDKARLMANGKIELIGREDRQVKLRGVRIELDEIEAVLAKSGLVEQSAVVVHTSDSGEQSLVAFVIAGNYATATLATDVQQYLTQHLPAYAVPAAIKEVNTFPLLSNGKINYKELLVLFMSEEVVAPATEMEHKVLAIWKEILGDKAFSTEAGFHAMGGNSLSIMRLIARIYKEFAVRITLNDIFNNLTIKKQAAIIEKSQKDSALTIAKAPAKSGYALSAAQERMLFHYELNKESTAYNLPMAWEIKGAFDKNAIQQALQQLVQRHESLRTQFSFENTKLVQIVKEQVEVALEEQVAASADAQQAIAAFIRPFQLTDSLLFRCGIIYLPGDSTLLVFDIHHSICDGMSQINLFSDFLKIYEGQQLPALSVQYKDYAEWEAAFRVTHEYSSLREYWLKAFEADVPKLSFPVTAEATVEETEGGNVFFKIDKDLLTPVLQLATQENATTFAGLFSLYSLFLMEFSGQDDIVIGINTAGRVQEELEPVVGMFVKTLPVRQKIGIEQSFRSFLQETHRTLANASSKQLYDLSAIISELNKNRAVPVQGLFDVMFVFQNFADKSITTEGVEFVPFVFDNTTFKYPITLFASEGDDAFYFRLEYSCQYFTQQDAELLAQKFTAIATTVAANTGAFLYEYFEEETTVQGYQPEEIAFNF